MAILKSNKQTAIRDHDLWHYSLDFYKNESNRTALLYLQNNFHLNINILLSLLWFASSGRGICHGDKMNRLLDLILPWQISITHKLRKLRQTVPKANQPLYALALNAEVHSEKIQLSMIYDFFIDSMKMTNNPQNKARQGAINLQNYFSAINADLDEEGYRQAGSLLSNAFEGFNDHDFPQLSLGL